MRKVDPKVDEAVQTLNMKDGPTRRKLLTGTGLVSATAAASREAGTGDASAAAGVDLAAHDGATPGVSLREPGSGVHRDECGARTVRDYRFPGRP